MLRSPKRLTRVISATAIAVGLGAGAAGIAAASTDRSTSPADKADTVDKADKVDTAKSGPDQDNVKFTPTSEKAETPDPIGEAQKTETASANDPEPNHQDPNGANVDHTPAGETPEPVAGGAQG